jgi:FkbM family methyltransferase
MYSQNNEEKIVGDFFKGNTGTLLSIGENNGSHLSNCLALIENGWNATLVEPSPTVFPDLCELHIHRGNVYCLNVAVANYNGKAVFYESGTHLKKGDRSLLSSLNKKETEKWRKSTDFYEVKVDVVDFKTLLNLSPYKTFEFISIDIEGTEMSVLSQINLIDIGCACICIEHNSNPIRKKIFTDYCMAYGLRNTLLDNAENIILSK